MAPPTTAGQSSRCSSCACSQGWPTWCQTPLLPSHTSAQEKAGSGTERDFVTCATFCPTRRSNVATCVIQWVTFRGGGLETSEILLQIEQIAPQMFVASNSSSSTAFSFRSLKRRTKSPEKCTGVFRLHMSDSKSFRDGRLGAKSLCRPLTNLLWEVQRNVIPR
jgi:hypothetical protein